MKLLLHQMESMNLNLVQLQFRVRNGVTVTKERGYKISFIENEVKSQPYDIKSKDYDKISPDDMMKFSSYLSEMYERALCKKTERYKLLKISKRKLELQKDFL